MLQAIRANTVATVLTWCKCAHNHPALCVWGINKALLLQNISLTGLSVVLQCPRVEILPLIESMTCLGLIPLLSEKALVRDEREMF